MGNIVCFIDYTSPDGQFAQKIEGWAFDTTGQEITFRLVADNGDPVPMTLHRKDRPDVLLDQDNKYIPLQSGFICTIRHFDKLQEKGYRQLYLEAGSEEFERIRTIDVRQVYEDCVLYVHLDKVKMVERRKILLTGWIYNLVSKEKLEVLDENGNAVPFQLKHVPREDVNRTFGLNRKKQTGFEIRILAKDVRSDFIFLRSTEGSITREIKIDAKQLKHDSRRIVKLMNMYGPSKWKENIRYIRDNGWDEFKNRARSETNVSDLSNYELWRKNHVVTKKELAAQKEQVFDEMPKISIVIPLYNTPLNFLKELVDSFLAQSYSNWQLCLADGSTNPEAENYIKTAYGYEKRITYTHLSVNAGISENTNEAIRLAQGDFVMFSDHDDFVEPDALYEIVKEINRDPETDAVYTDEDKVTMDSRNYYDPHFKPDFNRFLLCSNNYITHIFAVRRTIMDEVGLLRSTYDGAQDYDFILRCCEKARRVGHVPKILYHWRNHPASTAGNPESKMYAYQAGVNSVQSYYDRVGIDAKVSMTDRLGHYATEFLLDGQDKVSVILPGIGNYFMDEVTLKAIRRSTAYQNYEILYFVDEEDIKERRSALSDPQGRLHILPKKPGENFAKVCNRGAELAEGQYLLLMDNIHKVLTREWMGDLLGYCRLEKVAAAGARLLYENEFIHHAGIVPGLGRDKAGAHLLHMEPSGVISYQGRGEAVQCIGALSSDCLMVRKECYQKAGGLDPAFNGIYRSIDFSLRLRADGSELVYDPKAVLQVFEGRDKSPYTGRAEKKEDQQQAAALREKWAAVLDAPDPYYNPNFSKIYTDYSLGY